MILEILAWFYLISLGVVALFIPVFYYMENKVPEDRPIKKWWRKHVVGIYKEKEYFWKNHKSDGE